MHTPRAARRGSAGAHQPTPPPRTARSSSVLRGTHATDTSWLPTEPERNIAVTPIETGHVVSSRLNRVLAAKPPPPPVAEYMSPTASQVESCARAPVRYRTAAQAPSVLSRVAYQLQTNVVSVSADGSARAPASISSGPSVSGPAPSKKAPESAPRDSRRAALAALGARQATDVKHEFTRTFAGNPMVFRPDCRGTSMPGSAGNSPSRAEGQAGAAPATAPAAPATRQEPHASPAGTGDSSPSNTSSPYEISRSRRQAREAAKEREALHAFDEAHGLPHFPPRRSKFMAKLRQAQRARTRLARRYSRLDASMAVGGGDAMRTVLPDDDDAGLSDSDQSVERPCAESHGSASGDNVAVPSASPTAAECDHDDDGPSAGPPSEWVVDVGFEDNSVLVATEALKELRKTVEHQRIVSYVPRDDEEGDEGVDHGASVVLSGSIVALFPGLRLRQALYVSSFVFVDLRVPEWFIRTFASCFKPLVASVALHFHRCDFADCANLWKSLREDMSEHGALLRSLRFAFCKNLPPLGTGEVKLDEALNTHQPALQELAIHGTFVGRHGADALSRFLAASETIEVLDLGHTRLDDEGLKSLAIGVSQSRSLRRLVIDGVALVHGIGGLVLHAVQDCSSLTDVSANGVDRSSTRFRKLLIEAAECNRAGKPHFSPGRHVPLYRRPKSTSAPASVGPTPQQDSLLSASSPLVRFTVNDSHSGFARQSSERVTSGNFATFRRNQGIALADLLK